MTMPEPRPDLAARIAFQERVGESHILLETAQVRALTARCEELEAALREIANDSRPEWRRMDDYTIYARAVLAAAQEEATNE